MYKFIKNVGPKDFSDQFRLKIIRYKRTVYNVIVIRQTAYLVVNPITVDNFAALFNCMSAGRTSGLMMASAKKFI